MLASSGNWWSTASQKAWMVWIFSPPGVSRARAKSRRARFSLAIVRTPPLDLRQRRGEAVLGQHRPAGQAGEHAVGHVGGRGPRVCEAEDLRRVCAAEQQADDPLRQHVRLAGAGIRRDPGRTLGFGRPRLQRDRLGRDDQSPLHSPARPRFRPRRRPTIRAPVPGGRNLRPYRLRGRAVPATDSPSRPAHNAKATARAASRPLPPALARS